MRIFKEASYLGTVLQPFLDKIPDQYAGVNMLASERILLIKPSVYITNVVMEPQNYSFIFPTSVPPLTLLGKRERQFHRGGMITLEPEVTVLIKNAVPTREYKSLCISKDFFQEITWQVSGRREIKFKAQEYACWPQVLQTIAQFEEEAGGNYGNCSLMLESICIQMVIQILRATGVIAVQDSERTVKGCNHISKAIEYMHSYFNADIKIDDICREINLSQYHFIRLFKAQTGKTPHEYLMDIRLEQAEAMLRNGINSVEEVAYLCGFVNLSHFSSSFRRRVGMTPSEYRKKWAGRIFS
jgi:AraC-like DNA-binding protein